MIKFRLLKTLLFAGLITGISIIMQAQAPPPPPENPSAGGNGPVGGGAPLGEGLLILTMLGASYGGKKVYEKRKKD